MSDWVESIPHPSEDWPLPRRTPMPSEEEIDHAHEHAMHRTREECLRLFPERLKGDGLAAIEKIVDTYRAALSAAPALPADGAGLVKGLVWRQISNPETADTYGVRFMARCVFGEYFVNSSAYGKRWNFSRLGYGEIEAKTADEARAAAQADYEQRILSALNLSALSQHGNLTGGEVRTYEDGKYDFVLKPFLAMMERELHANSGKGDRPGWLGMSREELLLEIYYHLSKLHRAARKDEPDAIREFGADVANMAMMLVDKCEALLPQQPNPVLGSKTEGEVE